MNLSKIIGGILLVGAGCGSALAQGTAVATAAAPGGHGSGSPGAHSAARGEALGGRPFRGFENIDRDWIRHGGRDRHRERHHRFPGFWPIWGVPYWGFGGGYVYSEPTRDMYGYFGAGGDVGMIDGEPVYDYDRSYPYDRYDGPPVEARPAAPARASSYRCETQWVPDGSGGRTVPVRVCRR